MLTQLHPDLFIHRVPYRAMGMWIGRLDTTRASVRRGMLLWGVGLIAGTETLARLVMSVWLRHPGGATEDTIRAICETGWLRC